MEKQHLREQLAGLQTALREAERGDPEARALLQNVVRDIERVLDEESREEDESLIDRLRDAVDRFGAEHPQLAEAAGRVIDALARMGI